MTSLLHQLYPQGIGTIFERRLKRVPEAMRPLLLGVAVAGRQLDRVLCNNLLSSLAPPLTSTTGSPTVWLLLS